jgi:hypothetical protein
MTKFKPSFPSIALLIAVMFLIAFSHPANSYAYNQCNYTYEALLDTDNNVNTGGDVGVVQGTESPHLIHGIDYRVQVVLNICQPSSQLGPTHILKWNGSQFIEQPNSPYPDTYNIGRIQGDLYDGVNHSDVIEFKALKSDIGNPQGSMKIIYHASISGSPANDYTDPFYDPPLPTAIPTLSQWGMIILSLFLSVIALIVLRKRNSASIKLLCSLLIVLSITGIVSANFVCSDKICLDGLIEDWNEIAATPSVTDTVGDSSANDAGEDIYHGYIARDNDYVYFRIDIVGGDIPGSLIIKVEGHPDVTVSCEVGDYSCQAQQVCNQVTNSICLYQDYDCATGNSGSWYPPDGDSGGSNFNFAFAYDFVPYDYGNICACTSSQMDRYGLAATHSYCGLGHWTRQ